MRTRITTRSFEAIPAGAWIAATKANERSVEASFTLVDADGEIVASLEGVRFKAVRIARSRSPARLAYRNALVRLSPPAGPSTSLGAALSSLVA